MSDEVSRIAKLLEVASLMQVKLIGLGFMKRQSR
jgi:hypothetical protein